MSSTTKEKYVLREEDKNKLIDNIDKVDKTNNEFQNIKELSIALINVDTELKENREQIKILTENNNALSLRVKTLNNTIKDKDDEISFLKSKINVLKDTLEYWKDKFEKLIFFLHSKLHNWYDKDDKYIDVVNDILDNEDIKDLDLSKEKDDFER